MARRGVAQNSTALDLDRSRLNWDDLRIFSAVAEAQSFREAARRLGVQTSTVSRRIEDLEHALGIVLLFRSPDGVHLTEHGKKALSYAHEVRSTIANIERSVHRFGPEMAGRVRIAVTEGIGTYWLIPRLIEFQRANPHLVIDARCTMEVVNTLNVEAELSVQFSCPRGADVITTRLGKLHVIPFVSKEYRDLFGLPRSPAELRQHKIVTQIATQLDENALLKQLGATQPEGVISFRTSSSAAHYRLIKKGAGIGVLPSYAACLDKSLIPVDVGLHYELEIWLSYHPEVRNVPRIAAMIEWIKESFDRSRFPWFRDEYVPVAELAKLPTDDFAVNIIDFG